METLIFPGFSFKNKEWSDSTGRELNKSFPAKPIEWEHWQTGIARRNWIDMEVQKIIEKVGGKQINVIAKSIGTLVSMHLLKLKPNIVNRLILCGIPLNDISDSDKAIYGVIENFDLNSLLCIQNESDNHGSFSEAERFVHAINPEIKIISRPRSDHDYPYTEDFLGFLK